MSRHFRKLEYQPIKFILDFKLNYIQGRIVNRISKYNLKYHPEYLREIINLCNMGESLKPEYSVIRNDLSLGAYTKQFSKSRVRKIIILTLAQNYSEIKDIINSLIKEHENKG